MLLERGANRKDPTRSEYFSAEAIAKATGLMVDRVLATARWKKLQRDFDGGEA